MKKEKIGKRGESGTFIKVSIVVFLIALIVFISFFVYYKINESRNKNTGSVIVIENPMKGIVFANTLNGIANETAIIEEGVFNFNETYINYLFGALGTSFLHKSSLGYGNPKIEMVMGSDEIWNSELGDAFKIQKTASDDPDIIVRMSKEEAVRALMASDTKQYMKDSVANGKIQIEMIAGKIELYSKGYLDLYKELTGKDANI